VPSVQLDVQPSPAGVQVYVYLPRAVRAIVNVRVPPLDFEVATTV